MMSRSIGENLKKSYCFFFNYLPLQIRTLKICNHYISKGVTARSFKLCQQMRMMSRSIDENLKKSYCIFFELSPFADLDFENLYS